MLKFVEKQRLRHIHLFKNYWKNATIQTKKQISEERCLQAMIYGKKSTYVHFFCNLLVHTENFYKRFPAFEISRHLFFGLRSCKV